MAMLTGHCVMGRLTERMRLALTTSAVDRDPLRKCRVLSNFFANAHLLQGADIGYLALQLLSA